MPYRWLVAIPVVALALFVAWPEPPEARVEALREPVTHSAAFSLFGYPGEAVANLEAWDTGVHQAAWDEGVWRAGVEAAEAERQRVVEEVAARRAATAVAPRSAAVQTSWPSSLYPCGGDLPPCYVKMRESGGDYNARNPSSTASGAWQFLDSTWAGFGGYARAYLAPPEVQDERARQLWAGGRGCSHWSAC